jgi:hypothetical protein
MSIQFAHTVEMLNDTLFSPPLSFYSRKPVLVLAMHDLATVSDKEKQGEQYADNLDRHVDDLLKRPSKWRRTIRGVWTFLKTRECIHILCLPNALIIFCLAMGVCPRLLLSPLPYLMYSTAFRTDNRRDLWVPCW